MINRSIFAKLSKVVDFKKAILLLGPRQVGKTTLIKKVASEIDGALWENFLITERKKLLQYNGFYGRTFFWRTYEGQKIDYIEEIDGRIYAYEFKWNPNAKAKSPKTFIETYNPAEIKVIHRDNFWEWLLTYPY